MLNEKDLLHLAKLYEELDPNLSTIIITLATCRKADETLIDRVPTEAHMEKWLMSNSIFLSHESVRKIEYITWLITGGTENET